MEIMLTAREKFILGKAIEAYGLKTQLSILQEEAAELIAAISHVARGREKSHSEMIEEMADVLVVLCQMSLFYNNDIMFHFNRKLERLKKRLNNTGAHE